MMTDTCELVVCADWPDKVHVATPKNHRERKDYYPERTCKNIYGRNEYDNCENGFRCSLCGGDAEDYDNYRIYATWNYCPNCGARVISDEE